MSKKRPLFTVGLFVIIGTLIGVGIIIWVGASKYFQKGSTYVTYFDESVQGLQVDSKVKYQGVEVGSVMKIGLAPDNRLVEVVMKIDIKEDMAHSTVAKLELAGITGMVFVGLERIKPMHAKLSPKISFPTEDPVIPSIPSDIQQIFANMSDIVSKVMKIDYKGISDQIKATTKAIEGFLSDGKVKNILNNIEKTSEDLQSISKRVNAIMDDEDAVEEVIDNARGTLEDARESMAMLKGEIEKLNLSGTADKADLLLDDMSRKARVVSSEILLTSENLRRASENLELLMDRISADPSDIIFSKPPSKKRGEDRVGE